ncbi:MAG: tetratricopeptide repeat protein [Myxococcota bacterium]
MERDRIAATVSKHVRSGQLKKAIPELEKLVLAEPNDVRLRLELADLHARASEEVRAVDQLMQVARRYEKDGFGLKAMGVYLQVQRLQPGNRDAALALGRQYAEHGLYSETAKAFEKALAASPPSATNAPERLAVIQTLLDLDPDNLADRLRLAEAYSAQGQLADAARELRRVAEVLEHKAGDAEYPRVAERLLYHQPDDASVAKKLAAIYIAQDEPQRALPKLKKAYDARPQDLEVLGLLSECFGQLGQVHKSVAVLKEMARIYDHSGLLHERDECWTKVLALDPNDPQAKDALRTSKPEAVPTTFEVPYHAAPLALAGAHAGPPGATAGAPGAAKGQSMSDFDDFDADFDGDEPGFGGTVENTIVDDAYVPDDVRAVLGDGLALGGTPQAAEQQGGSALQEDLRELDFYINNGLSGEAEALLKELVARHGEHPLLDRRAQQVSKMK